VTDVVPAPPETAPRTVGPPAPAGPQVPVAPAAGDNSKVAKPADVYAAELDAIKAAVVKDESAGGEGGKAGDTGLWAFVAAAAAWGLISLVTPCVFPMIPITVSIFLKQAHGSLGERLKLAGVYCLTIIVVLGVSAFALLKFMAWLSAHPATNVLLGVLFVVLALSLFGMYEIRLPSGLANVTSARGAAGGLVGTVFMALTFTIISFTCVAPFYGGFIGLTASASSAVDWLRLSLGMLAFSATFACPFFFLALFPSLLRSLPKSGSWMNTVKVVMGFLELAAALKFFRAGVVYLRDRVVFFTYDLVLGTYIALALLCGLYLLKVYRLPHDDDPEPHLGVPRLMFSLAFLSLGFYLMPGLFKTGAGEQQRPNGAVFAWLDSFLLPDTSEPSAVMMPGNGKEATGHLTWTGNLQKGLQDAEKEGKLVFIDFTGKT
jgi:thiol:disulfide interchange protein DsbD